MKWACRACGAVVLGMILHCQGAAVVSWTEGSGHRALAVDPGSGGKPGFTRMDPRAAGLVFTNLLQGDLYLTNAVAHNGSGVAIGDVDGDGWADVYLCTLQGPNRLYRNLGQWRFDEQDIGDAACAGDLSTAAAFADVDGDGDLDLLVNGISSGTRLFLNDGKGHWSEVTGSGLSRTASATSMALADVDGDGDLDLYCTHYIDTMHLADPTTRFAMAKRGDQWEVTKVNGESTRSPKWKGRFEALPGGRVRELPEVHGYYRNDGKGHFTAIENEPGTFLDEDGKPIPPYRDWGLSAMFRDLNGDGVPDLYVCNDNTSPDRIWMNTGNGTFRAVRAGVFRHTSRSSMGLDVADLNRDGVDDIIVVDMLAHEPVRRLTQLVRDRPDPSESEQADARPQYNRNTLFFGRPDGTYVEAALLAGIAATDWTWLPVCVDVDLDGYEDLLLTNGFEFDVMDQDSEDQIKDPRRRYTEAQLKRSMQFRPPFRTRNAAFRNRGNGTFENVSQAWGFDALGVSFGMALGDLDNDGDLDVVVNNLNEAAGLYRNNATAPRVGVRLKGLPPNTQGIGARLELSGGSVKQTQEMICGARYLSCDQAMRVFAAGAEPGAPLRLEVRWRDGRTSTLSNVVPNQVYEIAESAAAPVVPRSSPPPPTPWFADVSEWLHHAHVEAPFDDWARQPLLPRRLSRLGPGVSWTDVDGDGWEDLLIAGARDGRLAGFHNEAGRGFKPIEGPPVASGDQGAVVAWADNQGRRSLLVATSAYELGPEAVSDVTVASVAPWSVSQRLVMGATSPGPIATADIDGDGDLDVFVGGRFRSGRYPEPVSSAMWINDGGTLVAGEAAGEPFRNLGMVSGATFADLDGDGLPDLALAMEWGPVRVFRNGGGGKFVEVTGPWGLGSLTGWWTGIVAGDFDGDGRLDLACGNWGRNSVYELFQPASFRLFYGDWNGEGSVRMIEAWGSGTNWFPVHDRTWLGRGIPEIGVQFPTHRGFAEAGIRSLLGAAFEKTRWHEATRLDSVVLLNRGGRFEVVSLPLEAQLAPAFAMNVGDVDGDGNDDLFLGQNFFGTASDISRDDGGRGLWLRGDGRGGFTPVDASLSGIRVLGEQRGAALVDFDHDGRVDLAVAQNNGPTKLYVNRAAKVGLRVVLEGPRGNPDAIGALVRVVYAGDRKGPCRAVQGGSGYWSQDGASPVMGLREAPVAVWVRWPGGQEQTVPVSTPATTLRIHSP